MAADKGAAGRGDLALGLRLRRLGAAGARAPAPPASVANAACATDRLPAGPGAAARLGRDADSSQAPRARAPCLRVGCGAAVLGRADRVLFVGHEDRAV